mgnify:CR=1 FL=1
MNKKYSKDFDTWNVTKKEINISNNKPFFNEREIWWCSIGINIDIEMDGKSDFYERPILIIKKINNQSALIAPIISRNKDNAYIYPLTTIPSFISISQMRTISVKRLLRKELRISVDEFAQIIIRIKHLLTFYNETTTQ